MMKSKSVKVADVVLTSQKTGEILRGKVIDAGNRYQGKVNSNSNPESFFLIFCDILCDLPLKNMVRAREKWMKYMIMGVEVSFEIF